MRYLQPLLSVVIIGWAQKASGRFLLTNNTPDDEVSTPLPIVLWHGMGDSCCAPYSIGRIKTHLEKTLGVFVHSINTGGTQSQDVYSTFFGNVNEQVAKVCAELKMLPELEGGYNAVGFSQGGQFLRAALQRCGHKGPPMRTLVTMGAQHQGVINVPACNGGLEPPGTGPTLVCTAVQSLLALGAYAPWINDNVIQAQYFKDPYKLQLYLTHNIFLPDINNERPAKNATYAANLASLRRLVLFRFAEDFTVVPKDSAWFSFYNGTSLRPMNETSLYQEDWIGLKQLDESGRLYFEEAPGYHMQFSLEWFDEYVVQRYLTGEDGASPAWQLPDANAASLSVSSLL